MQVDAIVPATPNRETTKPMDWHIVTDMMASSLQNELGSYPSGKQIASDALSDTKGLLPVGGGTLPTSPTGRETRPMPYRLALFLYQFQLDYLPQ